MAVSIRDHLYLPLILPWHSIMIALHGFQDAMLKEPAIILSVAVWLYVVDPNVERDVRIGVDVSVRIRFWSVSGVGFQL